MYMQLDMMSKVLQKQTFKLTITCRCIRFKYKVQGDGFSLITVLGYTKPNASELLRIYPNSVDKGTWHQIMFPTEEFSKVCNYKPIVLVLFYVRGRRHLVFVTA